MIKYSKIIKLVSLNGSSLKQENEKVAIKKETVISNVKLKPKCENIPMQVNTVAI